MAMCPFGSSNSSSRSTINKIRVNKINCSTNILMHVITSGYCVFRATDDARMYTPLRKMHAYVGSPAKDQDTKNRPLLFDRSMLGFNVGQVLEFIRPVHGIAVMLMRIVYIRCSDGKRKSRVFFLSFGSWLEFTGTVYYPLKTESSIQHTKMTRNLSSVTYGDFFLPQSVSRSFLEKKSVYKTNLKVSSFEWFCCCWWWCWWRVVQGSMNQMDELNGFVVVILANDPKLTVIWSVKRNVNCPNENSYENVNVHSRNVCAQIDRCWVP